MPGHLCEMRGFLTFLVLWNIAKESCNGAHLAIELEKRRGCKPSPGTLYPVLKDLREKGLIIVQRKKYALTPAGKKELAAACKLFNEIFYDVDDMRQLSA